MAAPSLEVLKSTITEMLKTADLSTLSSKKVRKELEDRFHIDLTEQKKEIDQLLMDTISEKEFAEKVAKNGNEAEKDSDGEETAAPSQNDDSGNESESAKHTGKGSGSSSSDEIENSDSDEPKKKKKKRSKASSSEPDDEALARELQEEEVGSRRRAAKAEKKSRKTDKSDKPRKKGTSTYSQECILSEELAAVMGTDRMARKDVVKGMWAIFKERQLQDPRNKQFVNCDEQLQKVFKVKRFKAFGMMKILKNHIKDARLVADTV